MRRAARSAVVLFPAAPSSPLDPPRQQNLSCRQAAPPRPAGHSHWEAPWRPAVVHGALPREGGRVKWAPSPQALLMLLRADQPFAAQARNFGCVPAAPAAASAARAAVGCCVPTSCADVRLRAEGPHQRRRRQNAGMHSVLPARPLISLPRRHVLYDFTQALFNMQVGLHLAAPSLPSASVCGGLPAVLPRRPPALLQAGAAANVVRCHTAPPPVVPSSLCACLPSLVLSPLTCPPAPLRAAPVWRVHAPGAAAAAARGGS